MVKLGGVEEMNKLVLKLFAIGITLSIVGLYFLIRPKTVIYCTGLGQVLIAMLAALIIISLVSLYLNIKTLKGRGKKTTYRNSVQTSKLDC